MPKIKTCFTEFFVPFCHHSIVLHTPLCALFHSMHTYKNLSKNSHSVRGLHSRVCYWPWLPLLPKTINFKNLRNINVADYTLKCLSAGKEYFGSKLMVIRVSLRSKNVFCLILKFLNRFSCICFSSQNKKLFYCIHNFLLFP